MAREQNGKKSSPATPKRGKQRKPRQPRQLIPDIRFSDDLEIYASASMTIEKALVKAARLLSDIAASMPISGLDVLKGVRGALEILLKADGASAIGEADRCRTRVMKAIELAVANNEISKDWADELLWRVRNVYLAVEYSVVDRWNATPPVQGRAIEKDLRYALNVLEDTAGSQRAGGPNSIGLLASLVGALMANGASEDMLNRAILRCIASIRMSVDTGHLSSDVAGDLETRVRALFLSMRSAAKPPNETPPPSGEADSQPKRFVEL